MSPDSVSVPDLLLAGKDPARTALAFVDGDVSYGELDRWSHQCSNRIIDDMGGTKGDRVVLIDENTSFWVAAYLGIMRAGAVAVPIPPGASAADVEQVVQTTDARIVFASARWVLGGRSGAAVARTHLVTDVDVPPVADVASQTSFARIRASASPASRPRQVAPDDLAALMFTSGSTAEQRGVMVSHRNIIANTDSIVESLNLTASDRIMTVLPFHYCFGTSLLHTHLRVGGSLVIDRRFMYPEAVLERMAETECTGFAGVPSHYQVLLKKSSLSEKSLPRLRYFQQAGGRLPPVEVMQLAAAVPNARVFVMYGQTEATARLSCLAPEFLATRAGSVGKAIPGVDLRVVDENGEDVRAGETGEIVARGENVTLGYWKNDQETRSRFRDGVLHTGDMGTVDDDGFIYIIDRASDFMKVGGERISCRRIEEELLRCGELAEVAVIPTADDLLGEAIQAFVVPAGECQPGLSERVIEYARTTLKPHLIPREVVVLPGLPRNAAGKVSKPELKALSGARRSVSDPMA